MPSIPDGMALVDDPNFAGFSMCTRLDLEQSKFGLVIWGQCVLEGPPRHCKCNRQWFFFRDLRQTRPP